MGIFSFFKRKKVELTEEDLKWNKMWDLWCEEKIESPYAELMEYHSEVNNGGHDQFFTNVENCGDIEASLTALYTVLGSPLKKNLEKAHKAYIKMEATDDDDVVDKFSEILEGCDDVFYENEEKILELLKARAEKIEL